MERKTWADRRLATPLGIGGTACLLHVGERRFRRWGTAQLDPGHETRELRSSAALGTHRRTGLRAAGSSYREIQQLLGVTYTWVDRHVTEGRQALRRADAAAEAEVEAAARDSA